MKQDKILLVDDLEENLFIISQILKNEHKSYQTYHCSSANDAKRIVNEFTPDLIITDWDMPDVSGIDLIRYLKCKSDTKHIPIIISTGVMVSASNLKQALAEGAIDFIRKPFDEIELCARVQSALTITEFYQLSIENKNYELSVRLTNLINNRKLISKLSQKMILLAQLVSIKDNEAQHLIAEIIDDLNQNKKRNSWTSFEKDFRNSYSDFQRLLIEKHPNLTNSELKLCHLILLDTDCKSIASNLHVNEASVRVSRSRLRKKLKLEREENIRNYLLKL